MSTLQVAGSKSLMLFSGRAYPQLADEIAEHIGVTVTATTARDFANGETFIKSDESVRGSDSFVIQSFTTPINQWMMETLILIDSLKRASAKRITVVAPFYPYARQDKKHRGRFGHHAGRPAGGDGCGAGHSAQRGRLGAAQASRFAVRRGRRTRTARRRPA
jgi:hypothetical protein